MAFDAPTWTGLDDMGQRGLGNGHVLMDARRRVALSGVVVASTVVGPRKAYALISPEDGGR